MDLYRCCRRHEPSDRLLAKLGYSLPPVLFCGKHTQKDFIRSCVSIAWSHRLLLYGPCNNVVVCFCMAKYCNDHVCLSVCLSASISPELHVRSSPNFFNVYNQYSWLDPPLACCDTLCTSGFMDDVIFAHNGPYGGVPV